MDRDAEKERQEQIDQEQETDRTSPPARRQSAKLEHPRQIHAPESEIKRFWKFKMRLDDDGEDNDWWFASTAIPLLAATLGPLANVLSIAALVTFWRMDLVDPEGNILPELSGIPFPDPGWCYWLNVCSLILGFVGNVFLLFNFTNRIRYIIALPMTIFLWYIATGILTTIVCCMNAYIPPERPDQTYTQGFWYAVEAAVLYMICSMLLMINMLGYFLGHYPQHFALSDHQRTLILQTMLFFIWLAGGGAIFSAIENRYAGPGNGWSFVDGLYFCDVTILTVGFGDLYPMDDVGRGIVFPYSVGGIISLGLVISSIHNFAAEISEDKVVKKHFDRMRTRTFDRTVTTSMELERKQVALDLQLQKVSTRKRKLTLQQPFASSSEKHHHHHHHDGSSDRARSLQRRRSSGGGATGRRSISQSVLPPPLRRNMTFADRMVKKKPKLILLREEKDRFEAMRKIQKSTHKFKRWWALTLSVIAFGILWCVGAVVFWQAEKDAQGMTYFQGLYFCYVSLLTIGYGDLSPKSNAGRCFFVVWSLVAVPTMTILISDMGDTVISSFKRGTFRVADFTILPKAGIWRSWIESQPWLRNWLQRKNYKKAVKKRRERGIPVAPANDDAFADLPGEEGQDRDGDEAGGGGSRDRNGKSESKSKDRKSVEELGKQLEKEDTSPTPITEMELARNLALMIRRVANDLKAEVPKTYCYEEWVEITRLIRFTAGGKEGREKEEADEGLIEWDWIGEDSPMMSGAPEAEFVLDRLCESLDRYVRRRAEAGLEGLGDGDGAGDTPGGEGDSATGEDSVRLFGKDDEEGNGVGDGKRRREESYIGPLDRRRD
ncbi:voltage-gated potassium channel [Aulographum hederae CBS 113979]|uniref:Voltage-gated potassium channel n=1 Tax=Aulographum hederae CBS 113979 TaxID=1176131 RepID=A0A6G1HHQ1_9PEZI|nr:voltage-gated potassium channel [Aulographum hederae CBS 113979]